jgi:dTDP-4-dehydrorhamnose reductase
MTEKKILILGKGFLGQRIFDLYPHGFNGDIIISDRRIIKYEDIDDLVKTHEPNVLINCIGTTGKDNVDDCEEDIDKTLHSNSFVPLILAEACYRNKVKLIHISSGCIFKSYPGEVAGEMRLPDFFDLFYSRTKAYSDLALQSSAFFRDVLILRIRIPLDIKPHPKNLLTKLIKYKRVIDTPNSVTYIPDFIAALVGLINKEASGIFNVVCSGGCRYNVLLNVYKQWVSTFDYKIIKYKDLGKVRTNFILSTEKLEGQNIVVRNIKEVYEECVKLYLCIEATAGDMTKMSVKDTIHNPA